MNKYIIFICVSLVFFLSFKSTVSGAVKQGTANVEARVGEFYLDLSGFASPYASIVLTTRGQFLRSVTADANGNFFISQVPIQEGFSSFCLESIDFKRVGDSSACFTISPATGSVIKKDIFLPPTIGVSGKKILPNGSIFAFGYTMPGATVTLHLGDKTLTAIADGQGYYKIEIKGLVPGSYSLFATASLKGKESEKPINRILIESLSTTGAAKEKVTTSLQSLLQFLISIIQLLITYIWIAFPILILIIILLSKKLRDKIKRLGLFGGKKKAKKTQPMHHYWMFGY